MGYYLLLTHRLLTQTHMYTHFLRKLSPILAHNNIRLLFFFLHFTQSFKIEDNRKPKDAYEWIFLKTEFNILSVKHTYTHTIIVERWIFYFYQRNVLWLLAIVNDCSTPPCPSLCINKKPPLPVVLNLRCQSSVLLKYI